METKKKEDYFFEHEDLSKMRQGVEYRHPVSIRKYTVYLRPITIAEQTQITEAVAERFSKLRDNARNSLNENIILAQETLKHASKKYPEENENPTITDLIMNRMTADELTYLHKQYVAILDKVNPMIEEIPMREVENLVAQVKKNPLVVMELSFLQLANIARYLATKEDSQTDK